MPLLPPVTFAAQVKRYSYLIRNLTVRDIRSRYAGSVVGVFWSLIHPALMLLIYTVVFSGFFGVRGPGGEGFALWAFTGLLPWLLFSDSLQRAAGSISGHKALVTKTTLPPEILTFATVLANVVNHGLGLLVWFAVAALLGRWPGWGVWALPLYTLAALLLALGLGWVVAALNVFARDIGQLLGVVLQVWFFATPIVYPPDLVPSHWQWLMQANPMATVVAGYRAALLGNPAPAGREIALLFGICLAAVVVGGQIFRRLRRAFGDVL